MLQVTVMILCYCPQMLDGFFKHISFEPHSNKVLSAYNVSISVNDFKERKTLSDTE